MSGVGLLGSLNSDVTAHFHSRTDPASLPHGSVDRCTEA